MNTPQVKFRVEDFTATVGTPTDGVSFVLGKAIRGRINTPDLVFNSWPAFLKEHGGIEDGNSAAYVKRLLESGGSMRFCNLAHYTDIDDAADIDGFKAYHVSMFTTTLGKELFNIGAKYPGKDYNNIRVTTLKASNGLATHFNLLVTHVLESNLTELYTNLSIPVKTTSGEEVNTGYLRQIELNSKLVRPVYGNLLNGGIESNGYLVPKFETMALGGGSDSVTPINSVDMIGSSASATGLYAFDEYEDSLQIFYLLPAIPSTVHVAANAYAANRDDLQYWLFLSAESKTKEAMIVERALLNINDKHTNIFTGYIKVTHPKTGIVVEQHALADIAGLAAQSDTNYGTHFSFSGNKRGILKNVLGVAFNFGTAGRFNELNELAQNQINTVINRDSQIKLWGSCTSLKEDTQERFINVVRATMSIKKSLRPILEDYLEEPNDMSSWKLMYYQVKPYLDELVTKRALFSYRWEGDQNANSLQDLVTNDPADITNGKYKVRLFLSFIASMQEIEVTLTLVPGNLTFDQVGN